MTIGAAVVLKDWGSLVLTLVLALLAIVRVHTPYWQLLRPLSLAGIGLAFVAMLQSALFAQEAPEHCFGSALVYRNTSDQLGFTFGLAGSSTMVSGFGFNTLSARLQLAGISAAQIPNLDQQVRMF